MTSDVGGGRRLRSSTSSRLFDAYWMELRTAYLFAFSSEGQVAEHLMGMGGNSRQNRSSCGCMVGRPFRVCWNYLDAEIISRSWIQTRSLLEV